MYILQIPGYSSYYKNQDKWRGGGVGLYIKKYNKTQGTTRRRTRRNYRIYVGRVSREEQKQQLSCRCFLSTSPWRQKKLMRIQKVDTILSAITTTWNKTIAVVGDTNIGYNKPSAVLQLYKEVIDTYNLKQHVKKANLSRCQNHRLHC